MYQDLSEWEYAEVFTVEQVAALLVGVNPSFVKKDPRQFYLDFGDGVTDYRNEKLKKYESTFSIVENAVRAGTLKANNTDDFASALIHKKEIKNWLEEKGIEDGFFIKSGTVTQTNNNKLLDYRNPEHPHYSQELDELICAWEQVSSQYNQSKKKRPKELIKQVLIDKFQWSENKAERFSSIANWDKTGGPPSLE